MMEFYFMLFVISGFSQAGKTTLISMLKRDKNIVRVVSCTGRKPRKGEKEGEDYYFLSEDDFKEKEKFIEMAVVHGFHYGTYKKEIENKLKSGKKVLWELDVQGAETVLTSLKDIIKNPITIFITTENMSTIVNRIKLKKDPNVEKRIESMKKEIKYLSLYNYIINTSKKLEESYEDIRAIIYNNKEKIKEIENYTKEFDVEKFLTS